jgi:hypothetical protein
MVHLDSRAEIRVPGNGITGGCSCWLFWPHVPPRSTQRRHKPLISARALDCNYYQINGSCTDLGVYLVHQTNELPAVDISSSITTGYRVLLSISMCAEAVGRVRAVAHQRNSVSCMCCASISSSGAVIPCAAQLLIANLHLGAMQSCSLQQNNGCFLMQRLVFEWTLFLHLL